MSAKTKAEKIDIADLDTTPQRVRGSRGNFGDLVVGCTYEIRPLSRHHSVATLKIYVGRLGDYLYFTKPCTNGKRLYRVKLSPRVAMQRWALIGRHPSAFPNCPASRARRNFARLFARYPHIAKNLGLTVLSAYPPL
jgi:hypothetical protein